MPRGRIKTLVHLSQQTHAPGTRLVPDHNDKGYGVLRDEQGQDVYFSHESVPGLHGFDDLRTGQQLEYTLESGPYARAASVRTIARLQTAG